MPAPNPSLVLYHANCMDGLAAAWAIYRRFGNANTEYRPVSYGRPAPDVADHHVVIVDFSYDYDTIVEMSRHAASVLVLDHHKTAQDALDRLPQAAPIGCWDGQGWEEFHAETRVHNMAQNIPLVGAWFDLDRSGCRLAWNFFHTAPMPSLLRRVEDRDLWKFRLPGTREVHAAISSYPADLETFDRLVRRAGADAGLLIQEGGAILRAHDKTLAEVLDAGKREMWIGGHRVPVANMPYAMASDAGHVLGRAAPFAATYYDSSEARIFSLRSSPSGLDVSAIAAGYGGGGHVHAAGFKAALGWEGERPPESGGS